MTPDYEIVQNDLEDPITIALTYLDDDDVEQPVDLTNATSVTFQMVNKDTGVVKVDDVAASFLTPRTLGKVKYTWISGDTDTAGWFEAQVQVIWPTSRPQTFPPNRRLLIYIHPEIT
jgi:hypothetical protein